MRGDDFWSIHEFRISMATANCRARPQWRLTAQPYPWGVQDAFDNSLATFWICGDTLKPGQFVEVDFHGEQTADAVVMEAAPNQSGGALKLEGQDAAGRWQTAGRRAHARRRRRARWACAAPWPPNSSAAASTTCWSSIRLRRRRPALNADLWGVRPVGEYKGARLYQLP